MSKLNQLVSQQFQSGLQRPAFSPGLLLEAEDLAAGVDYTRDLVRLMLQSLFGCGVVCGLGVTAVLTCKKRKLAVTIDPGLALDCMGNPIQVCKSQGVEYDPQCDSLPEQVYVVLCYTEKGCRPKDVACAPDDDSNVVMTRVRSGFEIKLYPGQPECACSCEPPVPPTTPADQGVCCQDDGAKQDEKQDDQKNTKAAQALTPTELSCKCYKEHNDGVCACVCGCNCVVLGKFATKPAKADDTGSKDVPLTVDETIRRKARPILTGYLDCLEKSRGKQKAAT
jgi:hypothetical protein